MPMMSRLPSFSVGFRMCMLLLWVLQSSLAKECTNIPRDNISHTKRALLLKPLDLLNAKSATIYRHEARTNQTNRTSYQAIAAPYLTQRKVLLPPVESKLTCTNKMSYGDGRETSLTMGSQSGNKSFLKEVSLQRVQLTAHSPQGRAQDANLRYLLMLDVESLIWSFRATAGLPTPGSPYGGWEDPNSELRGHFVGHYLSATAMMWASTGNTSLLQKMNTLVDALGVCQEAIGTGYLAAFPSTLFDRFERMERVWAPYYTIHKIMAGLLDQYTFAGNRRAFSIVLRMAKYFLTRVEAVISTFTIERHWQSLNEETGGMNDIMYRLSMITGNPDHERLAHLFDKPCFLGPLALQTDGLSGFHANSHIPIVVGSQMRYEATGDILYRNIAEYFLRIINSSHSYATGGTSQAEFWQDPIRIGSTLERENQETCTTYNMLKVIRNLFRWTRDVTYADYYERLLLNGIMGIQRGNEPGVMIYMLPQGPGTSKAVSYHGWGTPFDSFWCCYGTGIESFSKLGDSVYFEGSDTSLYVTQFVSSSISLDTVGLFLHQSVHELSSNDTFLHVTFELTKIGLGRNGSPGTFSLKIRVPAWTCAHDMRIHCTRGAIQFQSTGGFLSLSSKWGSGVVFSLDFSVSLHLEQIKDDRRDFSSLHALYFGPYLLAGMTDQSWELGEVNISSPASWIFPVPESYRSNLYSFTQVVATAWPEPNGGIENGDRVLVMGHRDGSLAMDSVPARGTNFAAHSTFRFAPALVGNFSYLQEDWAGCVSLELYNQPGRFLTHSGPGNQIIVASWFGEDDTFRREDAVFRLLPRPSGEKNVVSFEAASLPRCFLATEVSYGGASIKLQCSEGERGSNFVPSTSFISNQGFAAYHPISFIARGPKDQFLLFPLSAYKDESYTTYFDLS